MSALAKAFSKFWNLIGGSTTIQDSKAIFYNCKSQADKRQWYTRGLVKDDFKSRHTVLLLHIWMVHKRLVLESKQGLRLQECLFDEFWEDSSNRIRAAGINELSVNKRLLEVQKYSWKYCLQLDDAILHKADEEVLDLIGGSLWRSVYDRREDVNVDHVLEFAKYIKNEQNALLYLPKEAIFTGRINWGDIPWSDKSKGALLPKEERYNAKDEEKRFWREEIGPDGRKYYWNIKTRKSQWEVPNCWNKFVESAN